MSRTKVFGVTVAGICLWALTSSALTLKEYVGKPDDSYKYTIESTVPLGTNTVYLVRMTSQTWRGIAWQHWLAIIKPQEVKYPDTALLLVSGGDNPDGPPSADSDEGRALSLIATQFHAVVANLKQVPNQPLFDGKYEDAIIAYTYENFLKGEGDDWPLLLPMVKSAVRALDTIQAVGKEKFGQTIKKFMVTGASKRGWTTWLTAAADARVAAIAPMVIDVLNMAPQMAYQKKVYGAYSEEVKDYTDRGIQEAMQTPAGKKLLDLVDPYSYREQLTLPKVMILGTNDDYWTVDAARFYFNDLKGDKSLHYEPNAGHGLNLNIVPVIMALFDATLTGQRLPRLSWSAPPDSALEVAWDDPKGRAALWQAQSPNCDFRKSTWSSTPLAGDRKASAKVTAPDTGWTAYFVAVTFPLKAGETEWPYSLCTMTNVLPDTFPKHEQGTP